MDSKSSTKYDMAETYSDDAQSERSATVIRSDEKKKRTGKCVKILRDNMILILTLVAVVAGVGLGVFLNKYKLSKETIRLINFPGEIFMNMLKMMIIPLITTSLITGLAQLGDKSSRKMMTIAFSYYLTTTILAVITGICLVVFIHPGNPNLASNATETDNFLDITSNVTANEKTEHKVTTTDTILDIVRNIFPANAAQALFQSVRTVYVPKNSTEHPFEPPKFEPKLVHVDGANYIGIIALCIAVGICLSNLGQKSKIVVEFLSVLADVVNTIIGLMMWFSPIGISSLLIGKILESPELLTLIKKLSWYMVTVVGGLSIHFFLTLPLFYCIFVRKNPLKFYKAMLPANMTALATSSSAATLPVTIMCTETKLGMQKAVTNFVLPVGATINMDGTALYEAVACIFIAQLNSIDLSIGQLVIVSVTATLASMGAAAVPSAGLVTLIMVLQSVGLPLEDITLIISIDWMLDRYRTVANITGDAIGAAIVDKYVKVNVGESKGAAAVPSAGLVTLIMVLQLVGLPLEDITLIISVDWMLDRYRTVANITGDAIGAAIVDKYVKVNVGESKGDESEE